MLDSARFGNSKPCVRCLQTLGASGVRRVIFSTGAEAEAGEIAYQVSTVRDLLEESARDGGHRSRGDLWSLSNGMPPRLGGAGVQCRECVVAS